MSIHSKFHGIQFGLAIRWNRVKNYQKAFITMSNLNIKNQTVCCHSKQQVQTNVKIRYFCFVITVLNPNMLWAWGAIVLSCTSCNKLFVVFELLLRVFHEKANRIHFIKNYTNLYITIVWLFMFLWFHSRNVFDQTILRYKKITRSSNFVFHQRC